MKLVYVKYVDPMLWTKPTEVLYEDDIESLELIVVRTAGILIKEDESKLILGEVHLEEDNQKLSNWEVVFPRYRYVAIVNKRDILLRQDFEIVDITNKDGSK